MNIYLWNPIINNCAKNLMPFQNAISSSTRLSHSEWLKLDLFQSPNTHYVSPHLYMLYPWCIAKNSMCQSPVSPSACCSASGRRDGGPVLWGHHDHVFIRFSAISGTGTPLLLISHYKRSRSHRSSCGLSSTRSRSITGGSGRRSHITEQQNLHLSTVWCYCVESCFPRGKVAWFTLDIAHHIVSYCGMEKKVNLSDTHINFNVNTQEFIVSLCTIFNTVLYVLHVL